jgi:tRNA(Ile)-lysidine synthase
MGLSENFRKAIRRSTLIVKGDRILVAVSGGPDSVALLHLLSELAPAFELHLEVAHLQHGIRGEEARADARFVGDLARQLKLPFHLKDIDLPQMRTKAGRGNLEALAREERYRFLASVARQRRLSKVAVAHTLDDQAETFLMRLFRGGGRRGLGGMAPSRVHGFAGDDGSYDVVIIRPLLEMPKSEILNFLHAKGFSYRFDRTNQDTRLLRNWIRLDLLPQLVHRIDANLVERLCRQAAIFNEESLLLEGLARAALARCRTPGGVSRKLFLQQGKVLQRLILRRWIEETRGHLRGVDSDHIESLLRLIREGPPQGRLALPGGWELVREYEKIKVERTFLNPRRVCYSYELLIGEHLEIPEAGFTIYSDRVPSTGADLPASLMEAVFDVAALSAPVTFRNFRRGDRFRPLGMEGHKKLKELFIDKKVPLSVRASLPLLTMGGEVLWIPGYGRSEAAKIGPQTRTVLRLKAILSGV